MSVGATSFERRITRLVAVGLFLVLLLQVARNTIFNDVIFEVFGTARVRWLNAGVYAAIILIAGASTAGRQRLRRFRAVWLVSVAYGAVVVASTAVNVQEVTEARLLQAVIIPLTILSLGVCLPAILDLDDYEVLFRGVIVVFTLSAIASLWLVLTQRADVWGYRLQVPTDGRGGTLSASGLYTHRNAIGSFLQYMPALIFYLSAHRRTGTTERPAARLWWRLYVCALPLIGAHLLLTFSRSSQMVAVVSLMPLVGAAARARPRIACGLAAAVVAGAVITLATVPEFQRYAGIGGSLMGRERIWQGVLQQAYERPLFGFGLFNVEFRTPFRTYTPHNAYLSQFAYFGMVGLALFLALLVAFGRLVLRNIRSAREQVSWPIVMLVAAVLLQGLVEYIVTFPVFFANSMFWICLGLAARADDP